MRRVLFSLRNNVKRKWRWQGKIYERKKIVWKPLKDNLNYFSHIVIKLIQAFFSKRSKYQNFQNIQNKTWVSPSHLNLLAWMHSFFSQRQDSPNRQNYFREVYFWYSVFRGPPDGWESCCPWGLMWSSARRLSSAVRSLVGAVLGELLPVGNPCRVSLGRTASCGRDSTLWQQLIDHEGVVETKCYGLTASPILQHCSGEKCLRRCWGEEQVFLVCFQFSLL